MAFIKRSEANNVYELFEDAIKAMEEEPKRVAMTEWGYEYSPDEVAIRPELPGCGTVGCVAGWLAKLATGEIFDASQVARKIIGEGGTVNRGDVHQLFYFFPGTDDGGISTGIGPMQGTPEYAAAVIGHMREFMANHEDYLRNRPVDRNAHLS